MNKTRWIVLLCILFGPVLAAYADHNPLLPRPQQIHYGDGFVSLKGIHIFFSSSPNEEDKFAAEQLSRFLEKRTGIQPFIQSDSHVSKEGPVIILERIGPVDQPLALPGDFPGQKSREAYSLTVTAHGVKIHATSSAGIFYGIQTLRQLIEGSGQNSFLPQVEIHDWPTLAYRGTMIDMSHGPLPTEQEIEHQLDFLARWKENQFYLYSEASIELSGYPLLNPSARLTKDEVRQIIAYGRQRHIDVIPNLDLYAHLHDLFRIEKYSDLSAPSNGMELDPTNPKAMPLLTDWVNQFTDLFPSPFVNIGFDETGRQATSSTAEVAALFVKQLTAVTHLFQKHGKHVIVWDDALVKFPQIIPDLPSGLIAVAWYCPPDDSACKRSLEPLVAHHIPHMVQPAVMSYAHIAPDFDITFQTIDTFAAAGRRSGALGLINAVWADDAQLLLRMSLPGMAYGAAAPWQSTPMDRSRFFSDYSAVLYPPAIAPDVASALENMSKSETDLQRALGSETMLALWEDPFFPSYYEKLAAHREDFHDVRIHAEEAETDLFHAKHLGADPATLNSLVIGSQLLDYAGEKFQTAMDLSDLWLTFGSEHPNDLRWWNQWESRVTQDDHSVIQDLMDRITDLRPEYRAEWLEEYTPYRMGSALGQWDGEYQYWRSVHEKLREFNDSSHEGDTLPPLEEVIEGNRKITK